ncbi:hypothetical protein [Christensenella intestinihominis]|uniref:hypothetical protein n=1 Tax=Christensenella intestinihominis TaxID=1851429 RepID=UPI0008359099|nr:hypothetical protein [Christensenella intestinihominis]
MAGTNLDDIMEAIMGMNEKMDVKFEQTDQKIDALRMEMNLKFDLIESKIDERTTSRIVTLEREMEVVKHTLKETLADIEKLKQAR